ncbi:MAG: histidinol-phosphate transaminase [Candidatus Omnitrophica bacterium]|nr:histidinol-phosphate transaminase [Candidatus Omnitrophota bacterium]
MIEKLVRKVVLGLKPYQAGKPISQLKRERKISQVIKLASNENPLPPSERVIKVLKDSLTKVNLYPDSNGYYLRNGLAKKLKLKRGNIILGNGSSEIIAMALETFVNPAEEIIIADPSFIIYKGLIKLRDAVPVLIPLKDFSLDLSAMLKAINKRTKMIILCNPNNPTGTIIKKEELKKFMKKVPENVIILSDEAYLEYVEDKEFSSAFPYLKSKKPLIITRTFAKSASLAGLRIGYGIAKGEIIEQMNKVRPPFNTSSLAQVAALAALNDKEHLEKTRKNNREEKRYLYQNLKNLRLSYIPTQTNFICFDLKRNAKLLCRRLEEEGVIIRNMSAFNLPNSFARVTIGTHQENMLFIKKLKKVLIKK